LIIKRPVDEGERFRASGTLVALWWEILRLRSRQKNTVMTFGAFAKDEVEGSLSKIEVSRFPSGTCTSGSLNKHDI